MVRKNLDENAARKCTETKSKMAVELRGIEPRTSRIFVSAVDCKASFLPLKYNPDAAFWSI